METGSTMTADIEKLITDIHEVNMPMDEAVRQIEQLIVNAIKADRKRIKDQMSKYRIQLAETKTISDTKCKSMIQAIAGCQLIVDLFNPQP